MKNALPEATQLAIRHLIQTASDEGVMVAGFAFRDDPPGITSFGNCSDHNDLKLYESLCDMVKIKEAQGMVILETIEKPV
jgi:hypothetical protein